MRKISLKKQTNIGGDNKPPETNKTNTAVSNTKTPAANTTNTAANNKPNEANTITINNNVEQTNNNNAADQTKNDETNNNHTEHQSDIDTEWVRTEYKESISQKSADMSFCIAINFLLPGTWTSINNILLQDITLESKINELKKLKIFLLYKAVNKLFFKTTKGDGLCGYRYIYQLMRKYRLFKNGICTFKEWISYDVDLNINKAEFLAFLEDRILHCKALLLESLTLKDEHISINTVIKHLEETITSIQRKTKFNGSSFLGETHLWLREDLFCYLVPPEISYVFYEDLYAIPDNKKGHLFLETLLLGKNESTQPVFANINQTFNDFIIDSLDFKFISKLLKVPHHVFFNGSHYFNAGNYKYNTIENDLNVTFSKLLLKIFEVGLPDEEFSEEMFFDILEKNNNQNNEEIINSNEHASKNSNEHASSENLNKNKIEEIKNDELVKKNNLNEQNKNNDEEIIKDDVAAIIKENNDFKKSESLDNNDDIMSASIDLFKSKDAYNIFFI